MEHRYRGVYVPICNIVTDKKLPLNTKTLSLVDQLRAGKQMPLIHLQSLPNGRLKVNREAYKLAAAKMLGWKVIPARFSTRLNRRIH